MKNYLSFGGGVNSTALLLLLSDSNIKFETVFVNHGGDYPETYDFGSYLHEKKGFAITEIPSEVKGQPISLYDFCYSRSIIPSRRFRWCTQQFKVVPFLDYIQIPCVVYLGFDYGEVERAKRRTKKHKKEEQILYEYPLIDAHMDRDACIALIKNHKLEVPPKSGCFFCPFMQRRQIRAMYLDRHALYEKAKALELHCRARNPKRFLRDRPIEINAMETFHR